MPSREVWVALCLPALLFLHLLWPPGVLANHNKWWTCNDACARCARRVLPIDEMITNLYPGLFSTNPPSNAIPVSDLMYNINITVGGSDPLTSGTGTVNDSGRMNTTTTTTNRTDIDSLTNTKLPRNTGCCETVMEYATPPNVTIEGKVYTVVHLRHMFQFVPIGRCRMAGSPCGGGQCVDQYRAHWVLVFNNTRPLQGAVPVSFAPTEVPSHCECVNVGQP
ncbi:hypothetical protein ACOMHN_050060 [Nucella lapillus]